MPNGNLEGVRNTVVPELGGIGHVAFKVGEFAELGFRSLGTLEAVLDKGVGVGIDGPVRKNTRIYKHDLSGLSIDGVAEGGSYNRSSSKVSSKELAPKKAGTTTAMTLEEAYKYISEIDYSVVSEEIRGLVFSYWNKGIIGLENGLALPDSDKLVDAQIGKRALAAGQVIEMDETHPDAFAVAIAKAKQKIEGQSRKKADTVIVGPDADLYASLVRAEGDATLRRYKDASELIPGGLTKYVDENLANLIPEEEEEGGDRVVAVVMQAAGNAGYRLSDSIDLELDPGLTVLDEDDNLVTASSLDMIGLKWRSFGQAWINEPRLAYVITRKAVTEVPEDPED